jgi:atypical dual specificity phosphatase
MKGFWWFEENSIAGMARPGFNSTRWLPFDQAVLVGWLGQHSTGETPLSDFHDHVRNYGSKILKFYSLDVNSAAQILQKLQDRNGLMAALKRLSEGSELLESYDVTHDTLHFEFNKKRLDWEIAYLKTQGIDQIISLTEKHHSKDILDKHFDTFHFSINDLDVPSLDQVHRLAEILESAKSNRKRVAAHCLAGIGRTSTMLISARIVMGEKLDSLKTHISRQNPSFVFAGKQAEFIHAIAERYGS